MNPGERFTIQAHSTGYVGMNTEIPGHTVTITEGILSEQKLERLSLKASSYRIADKEPLSCGQIGYLNLAANNWDYTVLHNSYYALEELELSRYHLERASRAIEILSEHADPENIAYQQAQDLISQHNSVAVENDKVTRLIRPSFLAAGFFTGRDLDKQREIKKLLENAIMVSPSCLRGSNLEGADFSIRLDLPDVVLKGIDLANTNLWKAYLSRLDIEGADLSGADLSRAMLPDLILTDLSGTVFTDENHDYNDAKWSLNFYHKEKPPINLSPTVKDNLLSLDDNQYEIAKDLQQAYRLTLVSKDKSVIETAKQALITYLQDIKTTKDLGNEAMHLSTRTTHEFMQQYK